jgi:hypothetical protein
MSDSLSQAKSGVEIGEENARLREKLTKMQENYTQILKSKHEMEESTGKERIEKNQGIKMQDEKVRSSHHHSPITSIHVCINHNTVMCVIS